MKKMCSLHDAKLKHILKALKQTNGNRSKASKLIKTSMRNINNHLDEMREKWPNEEVLKDRTKYSSVLTKMDRFLNLKGW